MPTFQYKAVDNKTGLTVKNTVKAKTKQELYTRLKNNGLTPINIEPAIQFTLEQKENEETIEKQIKKEIKSKIMQIIGILILLILGTIIIIPTIQNLFNQMSPELELPWITKQINNILNLWYYPVIIILLIIIAITIYFKTEKGKNKWKSLKYQIPILGKIIYETESLKVKDTSELDKEVEKITKKLSKITNILITIILIFFTITVLIPSIQIYIQALTIGK